MAATYPNVNPAFGRKYLGRIWRRGMRVTTFATTPDEDRRVLAEVEQQRQTYRYSYSHRNCAFYAQQVLQLYLGNEFHANRTFDLGVDTPRALERALQKRLKTAPELSFRVIRFTGTLAQSWRQPPRTICETAIFDPKYALPLLWFQPYIYAGFGTCYGVTRLVTTAWSNHRRAIPAVEALSFYRADTKVDPRLLAYQALTGSLSASSPWVSDPLPAPSSVSEQPAALLAQPAF